MQKETDMTHNTEISSTLTTAVNLKDYKKILEEKLNANRPDIEENDDRAHNAVVNSVILENCKDIKMFCGEMSVFRSGFYDHISREVNNECSNTARSMMETAIRRFVSNKDARLTVYIENEEKFTTSDFIAGSEIKRGIRSGQIKIFKVDGDLVFKKFMSHMTVGDGNRMIRWESDKRYHDADCFFYAEEHIVDNINRLFGYLENAAVLIS